MVNEGMGSLLLLDKFFWLSCCKGRESKVWFSYWRWRTAHLFLLGMQKNFVPPLSPLILSTNRIFLSIHILISTNHPGLPTFCEKISPSSSSSSSNPYISSINRFPKNKRVHMTCSFWLHICRKVVQIEWSWNVTYWVHIYTCVFVWGWWICV